jgi:hypothetical protein
VEALRFVDITATGGREFPMGALFFTCKRFRRALAAAELACKLNEPESARSKIRKQFAEGMDNIRGGD